MRLVKRRHDALPGVQRQAMADAVEQLERELSRSFGYPSFKSELQKKAVLAVYQGAKNVFVSMPTGAGKSLCYQLPALLSPGTTLVVSPLIALIEDQVQQLQAKQIKAEALNSKTSSSDRKRILADLQSPQPSIKLLYVTPELIATAAFRAFLDSLYHAGKIARLAIDEAHCVSEWGHDFRPDYLKLGGVRECFSSVPCLALTATATPHVQSDVQKSLHMSPPVALFKSSCFRSNLFYDVQFKELLKDPLKDLRDFALAAIAMKEEEEEGEGEGEGGGRPGCGIVYCRTRVGCRMLAGRLSGKGVKAKAYHAGLKTQERSRVQQEWMEGTVPVIVATISFGMGVDKANVRFVAHWTMPKSVEAYYQESGRAGRDGHKALCRIYYSKFDKNDLLFLLKKEAAKKSRKGRGRTAAAAAADGGAVVKEATQKSFAALVKYCEEARCRHTVIAEFFGDPLPVCGRSCDYCVNAAAVKELVRSLQLCQSARKTLGSVTAKRSTGTLNPSLYGGGKWGYERAEEEESNSESSGSSSDSGEGGEGGEGGRRRKLKRGHGSGSSNDFFEAEFRKRRKLESPDREVETPGPDCRLIDASNFTRIPRLTLKVREHCLKLLTGALQRNATSCDYRHALRAPVEGARELEHAIFSTAKSTQVYKLSVHRKVSEVERCHPGEPHSSLLLVGEAKEEDEAEDASLSSAPAFVKASELVGERQRGPQLNQGEADSTATPTVKDDATGTHHNLGPTVVTSAYEVEGSSSCVVDTPSMNQAALFAKTIIVEMKEDESGIASCFRPASQLLLSNSVRDESHMIREERGKEPMSAARPSKQRQLNHTHSPKINSYFRKEKAPVEQSKGAPSSSGQRKRVADTVVRLLSPYYSRKRIHSKELFKTFAKKVSEHLLLQSKMESNSTGPDEAVVGNLLSSYFTRFGSYASDRDSTNLEKLFREISSRKID